MKAKAILAATLMLAACAPAGPETVVEPRAFAGDAARGSALLRQAMLAGHNRARADVGQPALIWNDSLAADAKLYADTLARTGKFEHAAQPLGQGRQGENLFTGTRAAYRYDEMVGLWVAEQKDFIDRPTPGFSKTARWEDVAHYTQIIWHTTRTVGCALSSNATDDYLVCRYSPPGNVVGERVYSGDAPP